ncbi:hypothetical protein Nepgr_030046 [Nepenthes gracilis]|uniref:Uncharacterized protein n=1 Tax=Nepenthes gracilis TaxID=150966 RepID=A0AAD3TDS1_NEPGR|nr:hypothetical protein Nepgr_030046 [Nepenthes gracilis]
MNCWVCLAVQVLDQVLPLSVVVAFSCLKWVIDYDLLSWLSYGFVLSLLWSFVEEGYDESDSVTVMSLMCQSHLMAGLFSLRSTVFWPIPCGVEAGSLLPRWMPCFGVVGDDLTGAGFHASRFFMW